MLIREVCISDYEMTDAAIETLADRLADFDIRLTEDGYELCLDRLREALRESELSWIR